MFVGLIFKTTKKSQMVTRQGLIISPKMNHVMLVVHKLQHGGKAGGPERKRYRITR